MGRGSWERGIGEGQRGEGRGREAERGADERAYNSNTTNVPIHLDVADHQLLINHQ